jgi:hypothetical protein
MDDFMSNLEESNEFGECAALFGVSGGTWDLSASRNDWKKGLSARSVECCFLMPVLEPTEARS